jgi:hydrogenase expression/formation protein HypC
MTSDAGHRPGPQGADYIPPQGADYFPPQGAECTDEVCITCSDTAVAVTIARLLPDGLAIVDTGAGEEEVSVALVTAGVGDTILVHAGEAIGVVGK